MARIYKSLSVFLLIVFLLSISYSVWAKPTVIKDIEVKGGPLGLAIDEKNERLFVLNYKDATLAIMNEKELSLIKAIPLNRPINPALDTRSVAYDPGTNRIYIATGDDIVLAIDGSTYETLSEIMDKTAQRFIPDLAVKNSYLYLLDWQGYIHRYNKNGKLETSIKVELTGDSYMHIGPLNRLYITTLGKGLIVVDGKKGNVVTIIPIGALSIPESSWNAVYVAGAGKLYVVDAKKLTVKKTIAVDYPVHSGLGIALNPNTGHLFLVTAEDTVTVINPEKGKKVDKLKVCTGPRSVAVNKNTNTVYVACPDSDTITVIKE